MMLKTFSISESYRSALWRALILSLVLGVLSALVLDGGETARLSMIGLAIFWVCIVAILWRRPQNPTSLDLLLIRWGCLPLLLGFQAAMHCVWHLRGLTP
jgi:hypothetical protein